MTTYPYRCQFPWEAVIIAALTALLLFGVIGLARGETPAKQGALVEIAECKIVWRLATDTQYIRCLYRIDEGEWKEESGGHSVDCPELRLPATSVHMAVIDEWFYVTHDEDVRAIMWPSE